MKINKQSKITRKRIVIACLLLSALLMAVGAYFAYGRPVEKKSQSPVTSHKQQVKDLAKDPDNKSTPTNTDTPKPVEKDDQNTKGKVQMTVSANISESTIYIRGGINNAVVTDGECYAQLTGPRGESLRKDTTLLQNASTTDCKTISLGIKDLIKGKWSVKLYYASSSLEGVSDEGSFEIK